MGKKDKELEEIREFKEHFEIASRFADKMIGSIEGEDAITADLIFALDIMMSAILIKSGASKVDIEETIKGTPRRIKECMGFQKRFMKIIANKAS